MRVLLFTLALELVFSGFAHAASGTQNITITINSINELSISGNPGSLSINSAVAGSEPTSVTDATSSYSFSTNETTRKITAQLNTNMPTGTALQVQLAAPGVTGWSSNGITALSTSPATLATGGRGYASTKTITYTLSVTAAAGVITVQSNMVTFTITAGP
jgi:hypothetical protein